MNTGELPGQDVARRPAEVRADIVARKSGNADGASRLKGDSQPQAANGNFPRAEDASAPAAVGSWMNHAAQLAVAAPTDVAAVEGDRGYVGEALRLADAGLHGAHYRLAMEDVSARGVSDLDNSRLSQKRTDPVSVILGRAEGKALPLMAAVFLSVSNLASALDIILPTGNRALFAGNYPAFYMYVPRDFDGQRYEAWQGGGFGNVRSPVRSLGEVRYMRLHEGVDIKPVWRDESGNPLDKVWAIADGVVEHVNALAGASNYGKYVVVRHDWEDGPFYSLYAHLAKADARVGDAVRAGSVLGQLGYTGDGIDKTRAHVHLEINMMLHADFPRWFLFRKREAQPHGLFHGFNLAGLDVAAFFLQNQANGGFRPRDFFARQEPYYKALVPKEGSRLDIVERHPWLLKKEEPGAVSWEITFHHTGLPLSVRGVAQAVIEPKLSWVKDWPHPHGYETMRRVSGSGSQGRLTASGVQYVELVTGRF